MFEVVVICDASPLCSLITQVTYNHFRDNLKRDKLLDWLKHQLLAILMHQSNGEAIDEVVD